MQTIIHRAHDRGVGDHGWLATRFSFSFADWYDPTRMGFGALRVLNDDVIAPRSGFGKHPHANMEIITIVMRGAVTHTDSMGNTYRIPAGDIQVMSAGKGVMHAEENNEDEPLELFQIWITPRELGVKSHYDQASFGTLPKTPGVFELLVSGKKETTGALFIHQDAFVSRAYLEKGMSAVYPYIKPQHGVYFFVVSGVVTLGGDTLFARDAIGVVGVESAQIRAEEDALVLAFEVPMHARSIV